MARHKEPEGHKAGVSAAFGERLLVDKRGRRYARKDGRVFFRVRETDLIERGDEPSTLRLEDLPRTHEFPEHIIELRPGESIRFYLRTYGLSTSLKQTTEWTATLLRLEER